MTKSTAARTKKFIRTHPHIRTCLQKDLVNYSALARHIGDELDISKDTSEEAILVAARRFSEELDTDNEEKIRELVQQAELTIKNNVHVIVLEHHTDIEELTKVQRNAHEQGRPYYLLEGTNSYTVITQQVHAEEIIELGSTIKHRSGLALVNLRTDDEIEETPGVVSYLTTLFAEHGVNIVELSSCWTDTIFVIDEQEVATALSFLSW